MASISEILILILIIICLLILPRMFKGGKRPVSGLKKNWRISPGMRAFIVISVFLPAVSAFIIRPWIQNAHLFILIGIFPVLIAWSIYWIIIGFKKR